MCASLLLSFALKKRFLEHAQNALFLHSPTARTQTEHINNVATTSTRQYKHIRHAQTTKNTKTTYRTALMRRTSLADKAAEVVSTDPSAATDAVRLFWSCARYASSSSIVVGKESNVFLKCLIRAS